LPEELFKITDVGFFVAYHCVAHFTFCFVRREIAAAGVTVTNQSSFSETAGGKQLYCLHSCKS